jgi:hypothetical protein
MRSRFFPALVAAFLPTLLGGCHAARSQARTAAEAGDLRRALDLYDEALATDGNDLEALNERRDVRNRLAEETLTAGERALLTGDGDTAERSIVELCERRARWNEPLTGTSSLRFAALRDNLEPVVLARVDRLAAAGRYLDMAKLRESHALRCDDLTALREMQNARILTIGTARCRALEDGARTSGPYAQSLAERACSAMGVAAAQHIVLPHQVQRVELAGSVRGVDDASVAQLRIALEANRDRSPLFDPAARAALEVAVAGTAQQRIQRTPTTLSHAWSEQVPDQDIESYQESFQEPYTATESYTERVPYTVSSYVNGRSESRTEYRSEQRTRTVTKYRTAWRTRTRPVTRYRTEPRTFTHPATHVEANYDASFTAELHAPGLTTFAIPVSRNEFEDAYEHSASFAPAGVSPSSGRVRSLQDRFGDDVEFVVRSFYNGWRSRFTAQACPAVAFTSTESAAKCVWVGGRDAPDAAFLGLQPLFGADVPALPELPAP